MYIYQTLSTPATVCVCGLNVHLPNLSNTYLRPFGLRPKCTSTKHYQHLRPFGLRPKCTPTKHYQTARLRSKCTHLPNLINTCPLFRPPPASCFLVPALHKTKIKPQQCDWDPAPTWSTTQAIAYLGHHLKIKVVSHWVNIYSTHETTLVFDCLGRWGTRSYKPLTHSSAADSLFCVFVFDWFTSFAFSSVAGSLLRFCLWLVDFFCVCDWVRFELNGSPLRFQLTSVFLAATSSSSLMSCVFSWVSTQWSTPAPIRDGFCLSFFCVSVIWVIVYFTLISVLPIVLSRAGAHRILLISSTRWYTKLVYHI